MKPQLGLVDVAHHAPRHQVAEDAVAQAVAQPLHPRGEGVRGVGRDPRQHLVEDRLTGGRGVGDRQVSLDVRHPTGQGQLDQDRGGHPQVEADPRHGRLAGFVVVREEQQLFGERNTSHGPRR
jgi:hypothetical protein